MRPKLHEGLPEVDAVRRRRPVALRLALLLMVLWGGSGGSRCFAASPSFHLGLSFALTNAVESGRRFDEVYGESTGLLGLGFELRWPRSFLEVRGMAGTLKGDDLLTPFDPPRRTGSRLELRPLHATIGRIVGPPGRWNWYYGGGPTLFNWREGNDLFERQDTAFGGHLVAGLQRNVRRTTFRAGLRYSVLPGAIEDRGGAVDPIADEDLGLLDLDLSLSRSLGGGPAIEGSRRGRGIVYRLSASGVFPTFEARRVLNSVSVLDSDPRSAVGVSLGASFPLAGPLRLSVDLLHARPELDGRLVFFNVGTTFRASGTIDMWGGILGVDVRLTQWNRGTLFLTPLVAHIDYEGATTGEFSSTVDRSGTNAGLGLAMELGRGRWGTHLAVRHLGLVRMEGFPSGFDLEPVVADLGVLYRAGSGGGR